MEIIKKYIKNNCDVCAVDSESDVEIYAGFLIDDYVCAVDSEDFIELYRHPLLSTTLSVTSETLIIDGLEDFVFDTDEVIEIDYLAAGFFEIKNDEFQDFVDERKIQIQINGEGNWDGKSETEILYDLL